MTELPKIVVNRLAGGAVRPDAVHPDADLLTALVEHSLGDHEKVLIISHLAECASCRDIVTFAQPDAAETPAAVFSPKPFWSGRLVWRWGALAACVVLAVALAVHRGAESRIAMLAEQQNSGPLAYKQAGKPSPSVANESLGGKDTPTVSGALSVEPRVAPLRVEPAAPPSTQPVDPRTDDRGGLVADNAVSRSDSSERHIESKAALRRDPELDQTTTEYAYSAPKSEIAPNSELALKKDQARAREAAGGAQAAAASASVPVVAQNAPAQASAEVSTTVAYAPTDKDEIHASSAPLANRASLSAVRQAATWQVTEEGNLQRSFDGGKNWESVSLGQPTRLRVVATAGFQVWAGGYGGALFHSWDSGEHFAAVTVRDGHATLTGDIVTLDFPDAQHGRIESIGRDGHEVWTTSDGGKTWRRP